MNYQRESLMQAQWEMEPLIKLHWLEMMGDQPEIDCDVDWDQYSVLENIGAIHFYTARDAGVLVGYHNTIITPHLHSKKTLHGLVDYVYLHPDYRRGFIGVNLLKGADRSLEELGVKKIVSGVKLHHDHGRILERLGYRASDQTYIRIIR